jgi:hypothetical protein
MLSRTLQLFLYALAALYGLLGATLFVAPTWSSANFAWRVSPFVAMTIGGWCLGNAWASYVAAGRARWATVFSVIVYLSLFGFTETAVLVTFRDRLLLAGPLAWLYLLALVATCLFAVTAWIEWWRRRPLLARCGAPTGPAVNTMAIAFILFVGFLGVYGLVAVEGMPALNAGVFPERLTPFSLQAFGAFYLCLALSVIPTVMARGLNNILTHGYAMYGALVAITVAAIVHIDRFDFAGRPTQLLYLGIYVLVGAATGFLLLRYGTGAEKA